MYHSFIGYINIECNGNVNKTKIYCVTSIDGKRAEKKKKSISLKANTCSNIFFKILIEILFRNENESIALYVRTYSFSLAIYSSLTHTSLSWLRAFTHQMVDFSFINYKTLLVEIDWWFLFFSLFYFQYLKFQLASYTTYNTRTYHIHKENEKYFDLVNSEICSG